MNELPTHTTHDRKGAERGFACNFGTIAIGMTILPPMLLHAASTSYCHLLPAYCQESKHAKLLDLGCCGQHGQLGLGMACVSRLSRLSSRERLVPLMPKLHIISVLLIVCTSAPRVAELWANFG